MSSHRHSRAGGHPVKQDGSEFWIPACAGMTRKNARFAANKQHGFTMVELVVSLSIASIVVAMVTLFLTAPMDTYLAQNRRSSLSEAAHTAQRLLAEDVAAALPNSLRTQRSGNVVVIEMLKVVDSALYRVNGSAGDATRELQISMADAQFATLGTLVGNWRALTLPYDSSAAYLAINHLGTVGRNAYALANVITPPNTRIQITSGTLANEAQVSLTPAFQFAADSPTQRVFLVEGPVAYLCDERAHTLTRYSGYNITSNLNNRDSAAELLGAGATAALVANQISTCQAWTLIGQAAQRDLLGVLVQFSATSVAGTADQLRLFQQFAVQELP